MPPEAAPPLAGPRRPLVYGLSHPIASRLAVEHESLARTWSSGAHARTQQGGKVCESRVSSLVSRYVALLTFAFVGANRDVMPRCGLGHRRCVSAGEDRIFATRMSRACTQTLLCSDAHTVWQVALRLVHCEAEAPRPSAARLAARRHARPRPLRGPLLAGAPRDAYCIAPPAGDERGGCLRYFWDLSAFLFAAARPAEPSALRRVAALKRDELRAWACHRCPRAGRAREAARIRRRRARLRWPSLPRSPPTSRTGCASAARYGQSSDAHRASIDSICTGRVPCGLKAPFLCSPRGRKEPSVSFSFEGWWWWPRRLCSMVYC